MAGRMREWMAYLAAPLALAAAVFAAVVFLVGPGGKPADDGGASRAAERPTDEVLARRLCERLDATGIFSAPCERGPGRTITVTAAIAAGEARAACTSISREFEGFFAAEWRLQIRSPWSAAPIAFCAI